MGGAAFGGTTLAVESFGVMASRGHQEMIDLLGAKHFDNRNLQTRMRHHRSNIDSEVLWRQRARHEIGLASQHLGVCIERKTARSST